MLAAAAPAFIGPAAADSGPQHQTFEQRPISLGVSGSSLTLELVFPRLYCYAGTLGALVQDSQGNQYILSNNHVLSKENEDLAYGKAADNDTIIQEANLDEGPCSTSSGDPTHAVADLTSYVPIVFGRKNVNYADAAIALTNTDSSNLDVASTGDILDIGPLTSSDTIPANPDLVGNMVQKSGRTTGHTFGTVTDYNATIKVSYQSGTAIFDNQIAIADCTTAFSDAGDSGSLIVNVPDTSTPREAVGLLFAGGSGMTFANPIYTVLSELGSDAAVPAGVANLTMVSDSQASSGTPNVPNCSSGGSGSGGGGGGGGGHAKKHVATNPSDFVRAVQVAQAHGASLLSIPGVVGYGVGSDTAGNPVIHIDLESARASAGQPNELEGIPVEPVVTGEIRAY